jgi:hypothetical protein
VGGRNYTPVWTGNPMRRHSLARTRSWRIVTHATLCDVDAARPGHEDRIAAQQQAGAAVQPAYTPSNQNFPSSAVDAGFRACVRVYAVNDCGRSQASAEMLLER